MGDHLDVRNSTFHEPFVGKSVMQVTQTVTTVARPDDKMYVVMRADFFEDSENSYPIGVAMTLDKANTFVKSYRIDGAKLVAHEQGVDGKWYRHFDFPEDSGDFIESTAVFIDVTNVI